MISNLSIKHYALIDSLEISFDKGLNIITGETGSGKSILLGALGLILGERADISAVKVGEKKCIIEGAFNLSNTNLSTLFDSLDLDFDQNTIIRREILANGKSRAFINDTPVKLGVLKAVGTSLVDIHSQHQTIQINNPEFQLEVLDAYANTGKLITEYSAEFKKYQSLFRELADAESMQQNALKELDYITFQVEELKAANLEKWQGQSIDDEYNKLANAEEIRNTLGGTMEALNGMDQSAINLLKLSKDVLSGLTEYSSEYLDLWTRLESVSIELDDVSSEIENLADNVDQDPQRLSQLEALKAIVHNLERKHGVDGIDELLVLQADLSSKLGSTQDLEMRIEELKNLKDLSLADVVKRGTKLSDTRKKHATSFCREIEGVLKSLNIDHAKFDIAFNHSNMPHAKGLDEVNMLFSANLGQPVSSLNKVASGGELSRVVLAIKKISSGVNGRLAMVFDEIDTGVSGEVANAMGKIIRDMSTTSQIICITHLPQIASKGNAHFKVFKNEAEGFNRTSIVKLKGEDRIVEIAQLLSGANTTDAALANARELLHLN